jgi:hypothetical protein
MQVGIKISPVRNDSHCEFVCWHEISSAASYMTGAIIDIDGGFAA